MPFSMAVDWLKSGQFWPIEKSIPEGLLEKDVLILSKKHGREDCSFTPLCMNVRLQLRHPEGRRSENRTSMSTAAEGRDGKNLGPLRGQSYWLHQPLGLTYSDTHFMEEDKISSEFSFSPKHPDSYSHIHIFLLHPGPNNCCWVLRAKKRVATGNECAG